MVAGSPSAARSAGFSAGTGPIAEPEPASPRPCDGEGIGLASAGAVRVFVVDDHDVVRDGVRMVLEASEAIVLVGEASTGTEGLSSILRERPDVAIVDVRLPDASGVDVIREVHSHAPEVRCVVFTSYTDETAFLQSVLAGAAGYLSKDVGREQLVAAVRSVAAGASLIDRNTLEELRARPEEPPAADVLLSRLTPHEHRILHMVARGQTNREIATALGLAEKTIRNYVSNILTKVGMRNRTQLAAYVAQVVMEGREAAGGGRSGGIAGSGRS